MSDDVLTPEEADIVAEIREWPVCPANSYRAHRALLIIDRLLSLVAQQQKVVEAAEAHIKRCHGLMLTAIRCRSHGIDPVNELCVDCANNFERVAASYIAAMPAATKEK